MGIAEIVITYFALGAPFGVYKFASLPKAHSGKDLLRSTLSYFFWPAAAPYFAYRLVREKGKSLATPESIESARQRIELLALNDATSQSIFEFREIFYRYTGLAEAAFSFAGTDHIGGLADIGVIADRRVASSCTSRRNSKLIAAHHSNARADLVKAIARLSIDRSDEVISLAADLANSLGDHESAAMLMDHQKARTPQTGQKDDDKALAA